MNSILKKYQAFFFVILTFIYVTPVFADQILNSVKTRLGQVVVMETGVIDGYRNYVLKLNNKIIYKYQADASSGIDSGPFQIGDDDVITIATWATGSCCYDFNSLIFLSINKNGSVREPKIYNLEGKLEGEGVNCFPGVFSELKLIDNKIRFSCSERDGRRSKTYKYVYENNSIRVSR